VTPTTSSIPSQWLGFENWSSFSGPQGLAPEPQLNTRTQSKQFHQNYATKNLPQNVQDDDSFHLGQFHQFPVDLQAYFFMQFFAHFPADHFAKTHFDVNTFVVQPENQKMR
jgi:hypothetical protein